MFNPNEIEAMPLELEKQFKDLENRVMEDIVRRIKINGEITRAADWQMHRLQELGKAQEEVKQYIQDTLHLSDAEIGKLYSDAMKSGYVRDEKLYDAVGVQQIPFAENEPLQQLIAAVKTQTADELQNITQSLGFAVRQPDGKLAFTELADYYQKTLDGAMLDIATGTFDYNTVLKRTIKEMTNSGLRTVDYASGWSNRVPVAARRALMTGIAQVTGKINKQNAEMLGTDSFEVTRHIGARPSHQVWQGRVYTHDELVSVCGLGTVTGLNGANCYHDYYPFIPGVSERIYTDEELDRMNAEENTPVEFDGKKYTKYEALQRQRRLETTMRAQRQEIYLLKEGGADEDDIIAARCRYRVTSGEYTRFSDAMGLPQQRERVTVDGLGNIGVGKYKKTVAKTTESGIINKERRVASRKLPNGLRTEPAHILTESEIQSLKEDIVAINADVSVFKFNKGRRTGYDDVLDEIRVRGDILPDPQSSHPRDRMTARAALAHEYYGHRAYRGTKLRNGAWNDEFRASYMAAKTCPGLSDDDRRDLVLDALERAKESGVAIRHNDFIRRCLYGT